MSYNSATVIADLLDSVARSIPEARVAIREHGSDAFSLEELQRLAADSPLDVRIEHDPLNPGFGAGCNELAAGSDAGWVLFLNPDAQVVTWPWTAADPPTERTIHGPAMVGAGETERQSGISYRIIDEISRSWFRRTSLPPNGTGFVSGAALLIDRASFELVGGFDEGYFMFYEDIDLCLRANDLGIRTVSESSWVVRHVGAHSTKERFGESLAWSYESACRFHAGRGESLRWYRAYVVLDAVVRSAAHAVKRNTSGSRAYRQLVRRGFLDLIGQ